MSQATEKQIAELQRMARMMETVKGDTGVGRDGAARIRAEIAGGLTYAAAKNLDSEASDMLDAALDAAGL